MAWCTGKSIGIEKFRLIPIVIQLSRSLALSQRPEYMQPKVALNFQRFGSRGARGFVGQQRQFIKLNTNFQ